MDDHLLVLNDAKFDQLVNYPSLKVKTLEKGSAVEKRPRTVYKRSGMINNSIIQIT